MRKFMTFGFWVFGVFIVGIAVACWLGRPVTRATSLKFGVTYSAGHAEWLGLDPQQAYLTILDELQIKRVRLSAYWNIIEPAAGQFDFTELDWQVNEAAKRNVEVLLGVGQKLPRWPECHRPEWVNALPAAEQEQAVLTMVTAVVTRYRDNPAVTVWQLENEPFVTWFGECGPHNPALVSRERELLRSLSPKPIMITDSGELSNWRKAIGFADLFGTTMYRVTWNPMWGYRDFPLGAWSYRLKARLWGLDPTKLVVAELQAEPWFPGKHADDVSMEEQSRSMSVPQLQYIVKLANDTGADTVYFWGAEWWLWAREHGAPEMWNEAQRLVRE